MEQGKWLSDVGGLLADGSRSTMLMLLMDGRGYTASELARAAGIAPSTASHHLQRMETHNVLERVRQGRHSYFRIANDDVASLIERMLAVHAVMVPHAIETTCPASMRIARRCYGHLAGQLGVRLFECALKRNWFVQEGEVLRLGESSAPFLHALGLDATHPAGTQLAGRACLDWSERRHHAGGRLGATVLDAMLKRRWFLPRKNRELAVTEAGKRQMAKWLDV